jgi:hypothetical protein
MDQEADASLRSTATKTLRIACCRGYRVGGPALNYPLAEMIEIGAFDRSESPGLGFARRRPGGP